MDMLTNWKRDVINAEFRYWLATWTGQPLRVLLTQDFFDVVDRRTQRVHPNGDVQEYKVNGQPIEYVTKANFDVIGLSIAEKMRRSLARANNEKMFGPIECQ
jgi:hypothetical protein